MRTVRVALEPPEAAPTGTRVAVVDSGVNVKHPWLKNDIVAVGGLTWVIYRLGLPRDIEVVESICARWEGDWDSG